MKEIKNVWKSLSENQKRKTVIFFLVVFILVNLIVGSYFFAKIFPSTIGYKNYWTGVWGGVITFFSFVITGFFIEKLDK